MASKLLYYSKNIQFSFRYTYYALLVGLTKIRSPDTYEADSTLNKERCVSGAYYFFTELIVIKVTQMIIRTQESLNNYQRMLTFF